MVDPWGNQFVFVIGYGIDMVIFKIVWQVDLHRDPHVNLTWIIVQASIITWDTIKGPHFIRKASRVQARGNDVWNIDC